MKIQSFEDIPVWQESVKIAELVYRLIAAGNFKSDFGLIDQIRRSAISISSNIAEWYERNNNNELIRFLYIAKWSAGELRSQLLISNKLGYIETEVYQDVYKTLKNISDQIGGFISYLQKKRTDGHFQK